MSYRFGKLWHLAIIWAIRKAFQCILQGVRFLLANHTRLSPTSENESYIMRYSEDSRIAMSRRRHSGFASLHATALASKLRQQSDWTGKNYLFNIDCRWLGPVSVYFQTRISCFTRLPIISSLSTGCSLTQDMGRDWHQHIPCLVMPMLANLLLPRLYLLRKLIWSQ